MDVRIERILEFWDYMQERYRRSREMVAPLGPRQTCWRPPGGGTSIGWQFLHLAEVMDFYLNGMLRRAEMSRPMTTYPGSKDPGTHDSLEQIEPYAAGLRADYRRYLLTLRGGDLDQMVDWPPGYEEAPVKRHWVITHLAEHESYHLGQVALLYRMVTGLEEGDEVPQPAPETC
ncbi:MAG TPA: DinB family protein [Acidobacteriota bacterium]